MAWTKRRKRLAMVGGGLIAAGAAMRFGPRAWRALRGVRKVAKAAAPELRGVKTLKLNKLKLQTLHLKTFRPKPVLLENPVPPGRSILERNREPIIRMLAVSNRRGGDFQRRYVDNVLVPWSDRQSGTKRLVGSMHGSPQRLAMENRYAKKLVAEQRRSYFGPPTSKVLRPHVRKRTQRLARRAERRARRKGGRR